MPLAIEQFDLSGYDLVLSSSHAVAKGVLVGPDQTHVSYVHSPIRYAWDLQHQYLREARLEHGPRSWAARLLLHYLRNWDARSANGVDRIIANSQFVARRIMKSYRRESAVIAPPVDVHAFEVGDKKGDFYLTASRMVPYKRIDMIVEAFASMPHRKLVVIGDGPQMDVVRAKATPNVSILGYQSFEVLEGSYAARQGVRLCRGRGFRHCDRGSAGLWYAGDCLWQRGRAGVGRAAWIAGGDGHTFYEADAGITVRCGGAFRGLLAGFFGSRLPQEC